jgi:hypothetical protein
MTADTGTFVMAWHITEQDMDVPQGALIERHQMDASDTMRAMGIQPLAPLSWTIHETTRDTTVTHGHHTMHYPAGWQHVCHTPATIADTTHHTPS